MVNKEEEVLIMRHLLAVAVSGLVFVAAPAFAQNASPVLIGQNVSSAAPQGGAGGNSGEDALAQVPGQSQDFTGLLLAGGLAVGVGALIVVVANQNETDNPVSP
jgi:hypothetical protein